MSDAKQKTAEMLDVVADLAPKIGQIVGGPIGTDVGNIVGGLSRHASSLLRAGSSVDDVLAEMTPLPKVVKPWDERPKGSE